MKKYSKFTILVSMLMSHHSFADEIPHRISALEIDVSQVTRIKLAPGLVSVLEFKEPVGEVFLGNSGSLKALISKSKPHLVAITLTQARVEPTNLIVFYSGDQKRSPVIFEIIPSKNIHQDYVKVAGTYGAPQVQSTSRVLLYSTEEKSPSEKKGGK